MPESFLDSPDVLVEQIRRGNPAAVFQLYSALRQQLLPYFRRARGADSEDSLHDVFIEVLRSVRDGRIQFSERLMAFAWAVARHQNSGALRKAGRCSGHPKEATNDAPQEQDYFHSEMRSEMLRRIARLAPVDQQILTRFYLKEEPWRNICSELGLTPTQFRLRKQRAKQGLVVIPAARTHTMPFGSAGTAGGQ